MHVNREIIPNIRTGYFHGEPTSVWAGKVYSMIVCCSGEMRVKYEKHLRDCFIADKALAKTGYV